MLGLVYFSVLFLLQLSKINGQIDTEIKQVYVILGKSPQTPSNVYPRAVYNATYWDTRYGGLSQITPVGLLDAYKLGQYIKNYYTAFLSPTYTPKKVKVRSVDEDASLQSLNSFMAGMYPPANSNQLWSSSVSWFPVPIHTNHPSTDRIFLDPCPKYERLIKDSLNGIPNLQNEFNKRIFVQQIVNKTGELKLNYYRMREILENNLATIANNLPVENWFRDGYENMVNAAQYSLDLDFGTLEKAKFKSGGLLYDIVSNIKNKMDGSSNEVHIYSVQNDHISALNKLFKSNTKLQPLPFGTAFIVELRQNKAGTFYVKVMSKNNPNDTPIKFSDVQIEDCTILCPTFDVEQKMRQRIVPDLESECMLDPLTTTTTSTTTLLTTTTTISKSAPTNQSSIDCPKTPEQKTITSLEIALIVITSILALLVILLIIFVTHLIRKSKSPKTSF